MHINPLGYATPQGPCREDTTWPVLPDSVRSLGEKGYVDWLTDAAVAIRWALSQPKRSAQSLWVFSGTSQGGGTALLLGAFLPIKVAGLLRLTSPFLTCFPLAYEHKDVPSAYGMAFETLDKLPENARAQAWNAIGNIDTLSHKHRLKMPVLLTSGETDWVCPPYTIEALFSALPATRSYTMIAGQEHGYTVPFLHLAEAWFRFYV